MTDKFLSLMKEVAQDYNIEITENAPVGGFFYKDDNGNLIKITDAEHTAVINDFCVPNGVDFCVGTAIYAVESALTWAA